MMTERFVERPEDAGPSGNEDEHPAIPGESRPRRVEKRRRVFDMLEHVHEDDPIDGAGWRSVFEIAVDHGDAAVCGVAALQDGEEIVGGLDEDQLFYRGNPQEKLGEGPDAGAYFDDPPPQMRGEIPKDPFVIVRRFRQSDELIARIRKHRLRYPRRAAPTRCAGRP